MLLNPQSTRKDAVFSKLFKILIRNFQESENNNIGRIMRNNHCFFAPQVVKHNNPQFQKLQN